jgi:D-glycero-D-manno-heptose 1,7-bisphosphate phosphatase
MKSTQKRFVVLDRDGTLINYKPYLSSLSDVSLADGAIEALRTFRALGLGVVVVTNQSGIGRAYFTVSRVHEINELIARQLDAFDLSIDGWYVCPHVPADHCSCRKPATGLVMRAAAEHGFEPFECFVVGDNPSDVEMGRRICAKTFLVLTGVGGEVSAEFARPDYVVANLRAAANTISALLSMKHESGSGAAE